MPRESFQETCYLGVISLWASFPGVKLPNLASNMIMKRILLLAAIAVIAPACAFAVAGKLDTLTFGFPDGTPTETQKKVHDYLTHDITLIEGHFMNTAIAQGFSGSADQLSELIQMLHTNRF